MEVAQFGDTELKVSGLKGAVEKLRQRDNGKDKCKMEEDFEVRKGKLLNFVCSRKRG